MDCLSERLASAPVFSRLSPTDLAQLARLARRLAYSKGSCICQQGEIWPNVAYIASGRAEWVILAPTGKRQVVLGVGADEVVWGQSLFDDLPMAGSLEVLEKCDVYQWTGKIIVSVLSRSTDAMWDLIRVQSGFLRRAREVIYGFAFHQVAGRLAYLLLAHYQPVEGQPVHRDLTLDEMAAAVGTSRELVCKMLYRFADEGMIRINRTEFVFADRNRLEELITQN